MEGDSVGSEHDEQEKERGAGEKGDPPAARAVSNGSPDADGHVKRKREDSEVVGESAEWDPALGAREEACEEGVHAFGLGGRASPREPHGKDVHDHEKEGEKRKRVAKAREFLRDGSKGAVPTHHAAHAEPCVQEERDKNQKVHDEARAVSP